MDKTEKGRREDKAEEFRDEEQRIITQSNGTLLPSRAARQPRSAMVARTSTPKTWKQTVLWCRYVLRSPAQEVFVSLTAFDLEDLSRA